MKRKYQRALVRRIEMVREVLDLTAAARPGIQTLRAGASGELWLALKHHMRYEIYRDRGQRCSAAGELRAMRLALAEAENLAALAGELHLADKEKEK